jgi:mannosyltransferase
LAVFCGSGKFNRHSQIRYVGFMLMRFELASTKTLNCYIRDMLSGATGKSHGGWNRQHTSDSYGRHAALVLWMTVLAGAVLRLIALGYKGLWLDEIASVAIARRATPVFWHFLWHDEGNMAGYYVLLRPWLHFGYHESTVRILSVIPGVLTIPVMHSLGSRLFSGRVGTIAALFIALNACAISVSQEARSYSFVVLLVILSTYCFVRLIDKPTAGSVTIYAFVVGLTCYFHYFGVLVPAAHYA